MGAIFSFIYQCYISPTFLFDSITLMSAVKWEILQFIIYLLFPMHLPQSLMILKGTNSQAKLHNYFHNYNIT